jgi:LexA-binding, inner membrane-associated putative hydrolase
MPSPLGHALGGAAIGWVLMPPADPSHAKRHLWRRGIAFSVVGMLPDLDLITSVHRGPSHSVTAAAFVGLCVLMFTRQGRLSIAAAAAYASHILLDWLGSDTSLPSGIMALWPFTRDHYQAHVQLFDAVTRRYWLPEFWTQNIRAVAREVAILLPLAWLASRRATRR